MFAIKRSILFIIIFLIVYSTNAQQSYNLSHISEEKLIIDPSLVVGHEINSSLVVGHEKELKLILLLAIDASVDNIINSEATLTDIPLKPYQYSYVVVNSDFSFSVMRKEKFKPVYDPMHPFSAHGPHVGLEEGFVWYPDIDVRQECHDIAVMLRMLGAIDGIEIIDVFVDDDGNRVEYNNLKSRSVN